MLSPTPESLQEENRRLHELVRFLQSPPKSDWRKLVEDFLYVAMDGHGKIEPSFGLTLEDHVMALYDAYNRITLKERM